MAQTIKSIKATKVYKALIQALGDEDKALLAYHRVNALEVPAPVAVVDPLAGLLAAGFTQAQAEEALKPSVSLAKPTSKELGEALVIEGGFSYAKGRVYANDALVAAYATVKATAEPAIVASSGVGRTKAVLVYKEESGDVTFQNLTA